ncbi:hypothetical protein Ciccas_007244 [Cichlidogyrus casuarinus]|uniref:Uncharacterized protein n=1 Tax=Cichlidogyrus casuarinus TaxID=1844966 RepID=A0ABD2Q3K1_9PLAT
MTKYEKRRLVKIFSYLVKNVGKAIQAKLLQIQSVLTDLVTDCHRYKVVITETRCFYFSYKVADNLLELYKDEAFRFKLPINEASGILEQKMESIIQSNVPDISELTVLVRIIAFWLLSMVPTGEREKEYAKQIADKVEQQLAVIVASDSTFKKEIEELKQQFTTAKEAILENPDTDVRALLGAISNEKMLKNMNPFVMLDLAEIRSYRVAEIPDPVIIQQLSIGQETLYVVFRKEATDTFYMLSPKEWSPMSDSIQHIKAHRDEINQKIDQFKEQLKVETNLSMICSLLLVWLILERVLIFEKGNKELPSEDQFKKLTNEMKKIPNVASCIKIDSSIDIMKKLWRVEPCKKLQEQFNECSASLSEQIQKQTNLAYNYSCYRQMLWVKVSKLVICLNEDIYCLRCMHSDRKGIATKNRRIVPWIETCEIIFKQFLDSIVNIVEVTNEVILVLFLLLTWYYCNQLPEPVDQNDLEKVKKIVEKMKNSELKEHIKASVDQLKKTMKKGWSKPFQEAKKVLNLPSL